MHLGDFIDFDAVNTRLSGGNKRSLLQQLAHLAGQRLGIDCDGGRHASRSFSEQPV